MKTKPKTPRAKFDYSPTEPVFASDFPASEPASKPSWTKDDLRVLHTIAGDLEAAQQEWTLKQNLALADFAIARLRSLLNEKDPAR